MTLLIFIFVIAVFIGVLVAIAVAHARQTRDLGGLQAESTEQPFSVLSVAMAFDPDHAIVWETQIPALRFIGSAMANGVNVRCLRGSYLKSARRYPELYDGFSFEQWLEFLERAQLIRRGSGRVALTDEAREFLHYRLAARSMEALATELSDYGGE